MERVVEPEILDRLSPEEPAAIAARRDLRKVNWWMRNSRTAAKAISPLLPRHAPHVAEIGAGDGEFFLSVTRRLPQETRQGVALLIDRQRLQTSSVTEALNKLGWTTEHLTSDVFEWLTSARSSFYDVVIANLFLHHFADGALQRFMRDTAEVANAFVAVEPRRSRLALAATRLLWVIGCNYVTRHDAIRSVRSGFRNEELSRLWPKEDRWQLREEPAGLFSHLFMARRVSEGRFGSSGA